MALTRTDLQARHLQRMLLQAGITADRAGVAVLSEAELQQSMLNCLQRNPNGKQVWVFAYGSLIWNPTFQFCDRRLVKVYGWHRRFCLQSPLGRGSIENPGLVLGLDRGGSCRGVAYRVDAARARDELLPVWRREMMLQAYCPRWVRVRDRDCERWAIAFAANRQHVHYAGKLSLERTVETIATARGEWGTCCDYLMHTVQGLRAIGIVDAYLGELGNRVEARLQQMPPSSSQTTVELGSTDVKPSSFKA
ncbi:gamma-glutamylcyclotransferase [Synechococcus sp. PCC 7336]|uniref:gamma-glutamylcyclotransferase n=1 Tax=Synechococcus sp. PCC 7336 TaxID=195250 RepID=UPI00034D0D16|nr:gamma-glutamylcyclotransferase [Synechococcus sp. PCC 7336]